MICAGCAIRTWPSPSRTITAREEAGHVLDNRLVRIEKAQIVDVALHGRTAHVTIRFDADIASITRDKDGGVIPVR